MVNFFGLIFWSLGIIFIIVSLFLLNTIISKYLKKDKFKIYFYLAIFFIFLFLVMRTYLVFYADNLANTIPDALILAEKILFFRVFLHIPFAIAATLLLIVCYGCLDEVKHKLSSK